jgi:hypothetical protein
MYSSYSLTSRIFHPFDLSCFSTQRRSIFSWCTCFLVFSPSDYLQLFGSDSVTITFCLVSFDLIVFNILLQDFDMQFVYLFFSVHPSFLSAKYLRRGGYLIKRPWEWMHYEVGLTIQCSFCYLLYSPLLGVTIGPTLEYSYTNIFCNKFLSV